MKKGVPDRTKGNTRPSSSSQAALILEKQTPHANFAGAFSPFQLLQQSSPSPGLAGDVSELEDRGSSPLSSLSRTDISLTSSMDSELLVPIRKLSKKDPMTKIKALEELQELFAKKDVSAILPILSAWCKLYCRLTMDYNHRVRDAVNATHVVLVPLVKKNLAPYLKEMMPYWLCSRFDPNPSVASKATESFNLSFPENKRANAIAHCMDEVYTLLKTNILELTPKTIADPKYFDKEEMQSMYERNVIVSLSCTIFLIEGNFETIKTKICEEFLESKKFTALSRGNETTPSIQRNLFKLLKSLIVHASDKLEPHLKTIASILLKFLVNDSLVQSEYWEAILVFNKNFPSAWTLLNSRKEILPGFFTILSNASNIAPSIIYPSLLPFLSNVPIDILSEDHFFGRFFDNLWANVDVSHESMVLDTHIECTKLFISWFLKHDINESTLHKFLLQTMQHLLKLNFEKGKMGPTIEKVMEIVEYACQDEETIAAKEMKCFVNSLVNQTEQLLLSPAKDEKASTFTEQKISYEEELKQFLESREVNVNLFGRSMGELFAGIIRNERLNSNYKMEWIQMLDGTFSRILTNAETDDGSRVRYLEFLLPLLKVLPSHSLRIVDDISIGRFSHSRLESLETFHFICRLFLGAIVNLDADQVNTAFLSGISYLLGKDPNLNRLTTFVKEISASKMALEKYVQCGRSEIVDEYLLNLLKQPKLEDVEEDSVLQFLSLALSEYNKLSIINETTRSKVLQLVKETLKQKDGTLRLRLIKLLSILPKYDASWVYMDTELVQYIVENSLMDDSIKQALSHLLHASNLLKQDSLYNFFVNTISNWLKKVVLGEEKVILGKDRNLDEIVHIIADVLRQFSHLPEGLTTMLDEIFGSMEEMRSEIKAHQSILQPILKNWEFFTQSTFIMGSIKNTSGTDGQVKPTQEFPKLLSSLRRVYISYRVMDSTFRLEELSVILQNSKTYPDIVVVWLVASIIVESLLYYGSAWLEDYTLIELLDPISEFPLELQSSLESVIRRRKVFEPIFVTRYIIRQLPKRVLDDEPEEENNETSIEQLSISNRKDANLIGDTFISLLCEIVDEEYSFFFCLRALGLKKLLMVLLSGMATDATKNIDDYLPVFEWWLHLDSKIIVPYEIQMALSSAIYHSLPNKIYMTRTEASNLMSGSVQGVINLKPSAFFSKKLDLRSIGWKSLAWLNAKVGTHVSLPEDLSVELLDKIFHIYSQDTGDQLRGAEIPIHTQFLLAISKCITCLPNTIQLNSNLLQFILERCRQSLSLASKTMKDMESQFLFGAGLILFRSLLFRFSPYQPDNIILAASQSVTWKTFSLALFEIVYPFLESREKYLSYPGIVLPLSSILVNLPEEILFRTKPTESLSTLLVVPNNALQITAYSLLKRLVSLETQTISYMEETVSNSDVEISEPVAIQMPTLLSASLNFMKGMKNFMESPMFNVHETNNYLFQWLLVLDYLEGVNLTIKNSILELLSGQKFVEEIMYLLCDVLEISTTHPVHFSNVSFVDLNYDFLLENASSPSKKLQATIAAHTLYRTLKILPALARSWWSSLSDNQLSLAVKSYIQKYIGPPIIRNQIQNMLDVPKSSIENLTIAGQINANQVIAKYHIDEVTMELTIRFPSDFPLSRVEVEGSNRVGVSEAQWRKWILHVTTTISIQNGSILDALTLWKQNVDNKFKGYEECAICYCIIHPTQRSLPNVPCKTCKHLFHGACLYKWFKNSIQSTCPLCRNVF